MRRLPLLALSVLMYFLYDVFGTVMAIQRERAVIGVSPEAAAASFPLRGAQIVSSWMGIRSVMGFIIAMTGAVLLAIQGFAYLYRPQTVDFYESRPEKRSVRFRNIVLNGFLIYMIPSLLGVLIAFLLAVLNGCAAGWLLVEMLLAWCFQTALFLAMYGMSMTASLLTGTVVTAVLMNAFFYGIEALARMTIYFHRQAYYATFDTGGDSPVIAQFWTLPPWHYLSGLVKAGSFGVYAGNYTWATAEKGILASLPGMLVNLLIFALSVTVAYLIYRARKAESAGRAVIWRGVEIFIKFSAGVLFSLCAGLFVYWIFDHRGGTELSAVILTILVTVFVFCVLMESIFGLNIRMAFRGFWHMPVIAAAAFLILFVYRTDVFGYDRWLPQTDQVESAWLANEWYAASYYDENGDWMSQRRYIEDHMFLTDTQDMLALAQIAQAERVQDVKRYSADADGGQQAYRYGWDGTVGWRMKNGRTVTRCVRIPEDIDPSLMDRIIGTEAYTDGYYLHVDNAEMIRKSAYNMNPHGKLVLAVSTEHGESTGDGALLEEFLEIYRRDLAAHYDFTLASSDIPVGTAEIRTNGYGMYYGVEYPLFERYTQSIDFLKAHGLWKGGFLTPEEVDEVVVEFSENSYDEETGMWNGTSFSESYTDKAQIAEIFAASRPTNYQSVWRKQGDFENSRGDLNGSWEIRVVVEQSGDAASLDDAQGYVDYSGDTPTVSYYREFLLDRVPGFVQEMRER
ncbi:MAG: hypothetical protein K6G16_09025 [Lachnospiraceae bacterium]|nr:hypothetical protein [Lachnospiraceae bacterium]